MKYRIEKDTLGRVKVPADRYYGAQTQRAVENFPVSGLKLQPAFVRAQGIIKLAAARANMEAGVLERKIGRVIARAAQEIARGGFLDEFVVDVFQAGAGTSQNMNANEVIANRAEELIGCKKGLYDHVHPNDHVNMSQSTNDTIHTAIHIAAVEETRTALVPSMRLLGKELSRKAEEFDHIVKCGRTHLQDAVPVRMGQVFGAYAAMIEKDIARIEEAADGLMELPVGGTAVGTGLNTPPGYIEGVVRHIGEATGFEFRVAPDLVEAMQSFDAVVAFSGALRVTATSLKKIADDFRLMGSGPRAGLAELELPAVQPGSSIMPGKVNPVLAEMLDMVAYHVMGCDTTITLAAQAGQLELNVMMPVIAYNLLQAIEILAAGAGAFALGCVRGVKADEETCRLHAERSAALATALSPVIGYARAAELAEEALEKDVLLRDLVIEKGILSREELDRLLDLRKMTEASDRTGAAGDRRTSTHSKGKKTGARPEKKAPATRKKPTSGK